MLIRVLQWLRCKLRSLAPNETHRALREQYAGHRIGRDEYERVRRDLCD